MTAPAVRAIREVLPEAVAFAVIEFITGGLLDNPRRFGAPLRGNLEGIWSARRGTYRVLYRIDEDKKQVVVLSVAHRRDAYRPL
ncbi:MAG: type II toxin-antitoxin system RelE/ParE family toxin [Acidimicrobiia bacterium]